MYINVYKCIYNVLYNIILYCIHQVMAVSNHSLNYLVERRIKLAGHILRSPNSDPLRQVTYQPDSAEPVEIGKRRIGRPRQQWTFRSNELIRSKLSHTDYRGFDVQNHNILTAARQRRV